MENLLKSIKENEGYSKTVYKCTEGYDTIGYGFAIKDLELSEEICEILLREKLEKLKFLNMYGMKFKKLCLMLLMKS